MASTWQPTTAWDRQSEANTGMHNTSPISVTLLVFNPHLSARGRDKDPFARLTENSSAMSHRPLMGLGSAVAAVGSRAMELAGG